MRGASCNGTCIGFLGPDLWVIADTLETRGRSVFVAVKHGVSRCGIWRVYKALSPRIIQEEVCRAPGSHHANPTCDDV